MRKPTLALATIVVSFVGFTGVGLSVADEAQAVTTKMECYLDFVDPRISGPNTVRGAVSMICEGGTEDGAPVFNEQIHLVEIDAVLQRRAPGDVWRSVGVDTDRQTGSGGHNEAVAVITYKAGGVLAGTRYRVMVTTAHAETNGGRNVYYSWAPSREIVLNVA